MKFCNMAVVVPVDQLTGSKAALSAQVWGQVSNLLMPALGKLYRQFHPANDAWGHKLISPFGVSDPYGPRQKSGLEDDRILGYLTVSDRGCRNLD